MVVADQGHPEQVCYGLLGGAVLLVANGGILQQAVATASNQTDKFFFNYRVAPQVTNVQLEQLC